MEEPRKTIRCAIWSNACVPQAFLKPKRTVFDFDVLDDSHQIWSNQLFRSFDWNIVFNFFIRCFLDFRMTQSYFPVVNRSDFVSNAAHAEHIAAIWRNINVNNVFIHAKIRINRISRLGIFRQDVNSFSICFRSNGFWKTDFLQGTNHAFGNNTAHLWLFNLYVVCYPWIWQSNDDFLAGCNVWSTANDLWRLFFANIHLADMQVIRIRMSFCFKHVPDDDFFQSVLHLVSIIDFDCRPFNFFWQSQRIEIVNFDVII